MVLRWLICTKLSTNQLVQRLLYKQNSNDLNEYQHETTTKIN